MTTTYINDDSRTAAINLVEAANECREFSVGIVAKHGVGKTEFLKQLNPHFVRVKSYLKAYQILGAILGRTTPRVEEIAEYVEELINNPRTVVMDETQDMPRAIYKYLKPIMDAGNVFIFTMKPETVEYLEKKHPDVLSRIERVDIKPLEWETLHTLYQDVDVTAFKLIFKVKKTPREIARFVTHCRNYAAAQGVKEIDLETALLFMPEQR